MDWRDEGVLLSMRPHGESAAIIEVLTALHGRHAGVVRGGASRKMAATLQPGTGLQLEWRARWWSRWRLWMERRGPMNGGRT